MTLASPTQTPNKSRHKSVADRAESGPPLDTDHRIVYTPPDSAPDSIPESDAKFIETAYKFYLQNVAREMRPKSRLRICLRDKIPGRELVEIWRNPEQKRAYYQNLMTCGRVYLCPVCAARITERRRTELVALLGQGEVIEIPDGNGNTKKTVVPRWHVGMATYTIQHTRDESAAMVLDRLIRAYKRHWTNGGKIVAAINKKFRIVGTLRALEPLWFEHSGFHFHYHVLYVCDSQIVPLVEMQMHQALRTHWIDSVIRAGGYASEDGFDFQAGDSSLAEYLNKIGQLVGEAAKSWGQLSEVTKYPVKRKNKQGLTLWELLDVASKGDKRAGAVWNEMIDALHGKTYLNVSRGLVARLGGNPDIVSDDKMAQEEIGELDGLFAAIGDQSWKLIKAHNKRAELLRVAGVGDVAAFKQYLESIEGSLTTGDLNSGDVSRIPINANEGVVFAREEEDPIDKIGEFDYL